MAVALQSNFDDDTSVAGDQDHEADDAGDVQGKEQAVRSRWSVFMRTVVMYSSIGMILMPRIG